MNAQSLVGNWKGEDDGEVGVINFDEDGYVSFTVNGEEIGGKQYKSEGLVFNMFYEINDAVTPHTMDFVIKMADDIEVGRMMGIYAFDGNETLIINMNFDGGERPAALDESSDNQITLSKIKSKKKKKK
jgi:hypothetical protein